LNSFSGITSLTYTDILGEQQSVNVAVGLNSNTAGQVDGSSVTQNESVVTRLSDGGYVSV
jgi:hypothetical protein